MQSVIVAEFSQYAYATEMTNSFYVCTARVSIWWII